MTSTTSNLEAELATARARLAELESHEAEHRQAEHVQALLYRIAETASAAQDMQEFYAAIHGIVSELMYADNFYIVLYDEARQAMNWPFYIDEADQEVLDPAVWEPMGVGQSRGLTGLLLRTGEPLFLTGAGVQQLVEEGTIDFIGVLSVDWLGVPLRSGDRTVGAMVVQSYREDARHSERDRELLSFVASHIGAALSRARAIEETRKRNAELAIINSVQDGLAQQLDIQSMYELVGNQIQQIFDAHCFDIAVYDREAQLLRFPYTIERGVHFPDEPIALIGIRRHVFETGDSLIINENASARAHELGQPPALKGEPMRAGMFAPMIARDEVIGCVSVQNLDREYVFQESDLALLTTLAGSLSVALENARLIEETRQRAGELETVNSVGRALAERLDLHALIDLVGERMRETFDADIVYVALHDQEAGVIRFPYYSELGERREEEPFAFGEGLTSKILVARAPLLLNNAAQFAEIGTRGVGVVAQSYLGVPIMVEDAAIGVISVQSSTEEGRFGDADVGLLSTLAANVGVAIQNARLYEAQREGERRYRELVEELPLAVYKDAPDASAASEYISPRVEAIFGYPPEAWTDPEFFASVLHPEDREQTIAATAAHLAGSEDRWSMEYRVIAADGRTVWVRDDSSIVRDEHGTPVYVQGFMIDVTDQALAHAEIRRQKQYFESLVEISPVAVVVMDPDERVTGWNPAATELFGYTPKEAIGQLIDHLVFREEFREEGRDVTREALAEGRAHRITHRARKDGGLVDVQMVLVPLRVDGEHVGFYAIYHDISALQRARQEAEAANQAKSAFLAATSHEIRTPMNAIIGMSGLLLGTALDPEQQEYAGIIASSGEALLTIINDILDFSKIEAGRMELEEAPFDVQECLEATVDLIGPLAAKKGLELAYDMDEGAPGALVGDVGRFRQILLNLLNNAVKFTEQGEVELRAMTAPADGPDRVGLHVVVRDTGIGIAPDRMDRLFRSFSQADASTSRKYGGTGLGLAISKRLAELMGGTIWVESDGVPGKGSEFHLTLVAAPAGKIERPSENAGVLHGKRILVVDDNETNRKIVVKHASAWGMQPTQAASGAEALQKIERDLAFDVAVVDMLMPGMSGIELARAIASIPAAAALPLILLSSMGVRETSEDAAGEPARFAGELSKPLKPVALRSMLIRTLGGGETRRQADVATTELDPGLGARHPLRILLAEDNAVNQRLALRLLEKMGYSADVAANGLEAIQAVERQTYDLILMDVQMPEMDGLEATRQIVSRWKKHERPRIVAMTADAMQEDRDRCLEAGMDHYLTKPVRNAELVAAIEGTERRDEPPAMSEGGPGSPTPAISQETLDRLVDSMGDPAFVAELLETFTGDANTMLDELDRAIRDADVETARRTAHTLKSNAATFGAVPLSDACRQLEALAKTGGLEGAPELAELVRSQYERASVELIAMKAALEGA